MVKYIYNEGLEQGYQVSYYNWLAHEQAKGGNQSVVPPGEFAVADKRTRELWWHTDPVLCTVYIQPSGHLWQIVVLTVDIINHGALRRRSHREGVSPILVVN
jgi:hypothetical protein